MSKEGKERHGSQTFYKLVEEVVEMHDKKSHDYASNEDPYGNYHFAGKMSQLFKNSDDAGFVGRIGEKLFRLANLENSEKTAKNESVEDTEKDIVTITILWMADRRDRRNKGFNSVKELMNSSMEEIGRKLSEEVNEERKKQLAEGSWEGFPEKNLRTPIQELKDSK